MAIAKMNEIADAIRQAAQDKREAEGLEIMFKIRNLGVIQYCDGTTVWQYKHGLNDPHLLATPGFFSEAQDMMNVGDSILVITHIGNLWLRVNDCIGGQLIVGPFIDAKAIFPA